MRKRKACRKNSRQYLLYANLVKIYFLEKNFLLHILDTLIPLHGLVLVLPVGQKVLKLTCANGIGMVVPVILLAVHWRIYG